MKAMEPDQLLKHLASLGVPAANQLQEHAIERHELGQLAGGFRSAIAAAGGRNARTVEGRRTFQTLLTAAAFDGDGGERLTLKRRSEFLGTHPDLLTAARGRMESLQPDMPSAEAIQKGVYWHRPRERRRDATPLEMLLLMRSYWHNDAVTRPSGNSAKRDMWRESKKKDAPFHPRRQLTEERGGEGVFQKFLLSNELQNFLLTWKEEKGEVFQAPGRTLFLSTRCKCLTLPKKEQCCCKIHTQQQWYIDALRNIAVLGRDQCNCRVCSTEGGKGWGAQWTHLGTFSDALLCPKTDLRRGDPHDKHGFMGRAPACVSSACSTCGFGRDGGIPTCKAVEQSDQLVRWKCFEDSETEGKDGEKKILHNQQVEKEGKLRDFWPIFVRHSKDYMVHHSVAKWQRNCHEICLNTFEDGDMLVETDFIQGYNHQHRQSLTCDRTERTTMMVAIVHFSPQVRDGGGRTHMTETWILASGDPNHDFDYHRHGMALIGAHYLSGDGREATAAAREEKRTPRMHLFTDGCAKQYKGKREFRWVANSEAELGFLVTHHFPGSSHFKGCHDGFGGIPKNAMRNAETHGQYINGAAGVVKFLDEYFKHIAGRTVEEYFARWTPYRVRCVHVKHIGRTAIYRPKIALKGIGGTQSTYLFDGVESTTCNAASGTESKALDLLLAQGVDLAPEMKSAEVAEMGLTVRWVKPYKPFSEQEEEEEQTEEGGEGQEEEKEEAGVAVGRAPRKKRKPAHLRDFDVDGGEDGVVPGRLQRKRKKPLRLRTSDDEESSESEGDEQGSESDFSDPGEGNEEDRAGSESGSESGAGSESGSGSDSEAGSESDQPEQGKGESTEKKQATEMLCARKVVRRHNLRTCKASCFCSACRLHRYDLCYTHELHPNHVPKYAAGVIEETVVMVTGVPPPGKNMGVECRAALAEKAQKKKKC